MSRPLQKYKDILDELSLEGRLRSLKHSTDEALIDCTSNDYLAIGKDPLLREEFLHFIESKGLIPPFGSCSSRLLYTNEDYYGDFEKLLSRLYDKEALIFNSGYHANVGILSSLSVPGTLILSDQLVHASIIDGIRLGKAIRKIFPHNDISSLERILKEEANKHERVLIVIESVYSMDGDTSPLEEIVRLKNRFNNVMLYVDEAHAIGVKGECGLGLCESFGLVKDVDVIVATLSKAVASMGAFAIVNDVLKNFLINSSRALIFSTAIPPLNIAWSQFILGRILDMDDRRKRLSKISRELSAFILKLTGEGEDHDSPIIPLMIGGNHRTVEASQIMYGSGVLALPIRRPTVAEGTERIRISLNASISDIELAQIKGAVMRVANDLLSDK